MSHALRYEYPFDPAQENNTAASIYRLARAAGRTVLDVGSGPGVVARVLAEVDGREVTCLDNDEAALAEAAEHGMRTSVVDLEDDAWLKELQGSEFDVVVLADVLEHLREPGRALRGLVEHEVVSPAGRLVISVPNAAHESVLAELMVGDFAYTETGILDATHVRWFTLTSLTRLLEATGFVVSRVMRTERTLEQTSSRYRAAQLPDEVRALLGTLGPDAGTYQYVLECHRATNSGYIASLRSQFDDVARERMTEREEVRLLQGSVTALQEQVSRDADAHRLELEALRALAREERELSVAEMQRGAVELERMRAMLAAVPDGSAAASDAEEKLRAVRDSRSYKVARLTARVGRRVLGPAVAARRRVRRSR